MIRRIGARRFFEWQVAISTKEIDPDTRQVKFVIPPDGDEVLTTKREFDLAF